MKWPINGFMVYWPITRHVMGGWMKALPPILKILAWKRFMVPAGITCIRQPAFGETGWVMRRIFGEGIFCCITDIAGVVKVSLLTRILTGSRTIRLYPITRK